MNPTNVTPCHYSPPSTCDHFACAQRAETASLRARAERAEASLAAYRDAETVLAAVVLAAGGVVVLSDAALVNSFGLVLEMETNPGGGRIYRARDRSTSPLNTPESK